LSFYHKTSVYTLVNNNIKELAHRKQQKLQKLTLFPSTLTHSQCDAGNKILKYCFPTGDQLQRYWVTSLFDLGFR